MDALTSPAIRKIREDVPEFESTLQTVLADEGGEMGPFQAMSTFAQWLLDILRADSHAEEVER